MSYFEQVKKAIPIILAIGFIIFVIFYKPNIHNLNIDNIVNTSDMIEPQISNDCMGIDLYLDFAYEGLTGDQQSIDKAIDILKANCLWFLNSETDDFNGDQKNEISMVAGGAGCGSCHWNLLYIIKDNRIIFEKEQEDINIWAVKGTGFAIKYPIRKEGEPMCCPTEGIVEVYKANNAGESFIKVEEYIEAYPIR